MPKRSAVISSKDKADAHVTARVTTPNVSLTKLAAACKERAREREREPGSLWLLDNMIRSFHYDKWSPIKWRLCCHGDCNIYSHNRLLKLLEMFSLISLLVYCWLENKN